MLFIDTYDEFFINLYKASWVNNKTVDQNRLYLGFLDKINSKLEISLGYMLRNIFSSPMRTEHIILFDMTYSLDD